MKKKLILIVDDDADLRNIYHRMLTKDGYMNIIEAASGNDAISKALHKSPELILMDKNMPGKDGLTTAKEIAHVIPPSKIIISTGDISQKDTLDCIEIGISNFIQKPIEMEQLTSVIKRVLST